MSWILDEPVKNFTQSVVDETIKANTDFQSKAGLSPKIIWKTSGKCCDWCDKITGTYDYEDVKDTGNNVFLRHRYCRCTVDYDPRRGKRQNAHTKKWRDSKKADKIGVRNNFNPRPNNRKFTKTRHSRIKQDQREITDKDIN